jgi:hypothetical protein
MIARVNKDNREGSLNAARMPYKSYKLNAQSSVTKILNQGLPLAQGKGNVSLLVT